MKYSKLLALRASSAWGDRLWTFGAGVFMAKFDESHYRLVGIYGFTLCLTVVLFGTTLGHWIDGSKRFPAALSLLFVQNLSTLIACALIASELTWEYLPYLIIFIASISNLASQGSNILLEKDWIIVIASGNSELLAKLNSIFRTIDLLCLILSPLGAGLLFEYTSNRITALSIGLWNIISFLIEFILYWFVYNDFKNLSNKDTSNKDSKKGQIQSLKYYVNSPLKYGGLSLALLYLTVLGFDNITWAYCLSLGISETILGVSTAISALVGVIASLTFPLIRKSFGLYKTGIIGFSCLSISLIPCVVSIWIKGKFLKNDSFIF
ncbi:SLC40A1 [Lepeophtheirus salmonis]|uniref:Solute carrier family 40 member n=1 Tax=Lepeophtheirus salmonis TaxID=72036 RepID=A0A7R8CPD9_LEPSM|nr:SLC40A1 [Lepeophtheirus salmonis]CAF2885327.1 SLC40A1 [Lepeophtheirus salmonis]